MNMRKMKMVTLVLLCVLTAGLCGIFAYGMSGRGIYIGAQSYESYGADPKLVFEKEVPLDGIDTILVQYDMNNNDIYLYEGEKDVLTIREYNELDLKEGDLSTDSDGQQGRSPGKKTEWEGISGEAWTVWFQIGHWLHGGHSASFL